MGGTLQSLTNGVMSDQKSELKDSSSWAHELTTGITDLVDLIILQDPPSAPKQDPA